MKRTLGIVLGLALLLAACGGGAPQPPPPPPPTNAPATSGGGAAAGLPPRVADDSADRAAAIERARSAIDGTLRGSEREDLLNLLAAAETMADEAQRYQAYLGAWQYMRLIYLQRGSTAEQKAVLDATEAIARTFPQYQADQFQAQKRA